LTYRGHAGGVTGVAWSPDGTYIASAGNDATAQVWDAMTGKLLLTYRADTGGSPVALAWSPDGKYLVASEFRQSTPQVNKCTVQVIDAKTGKTILTYNGHTSLV
jgi:WD40 repeat protein